MSRYLESVKKLHPTAEIERIKNNHLCLVKYPGLTLALSYQLLIAFCADEDWHISTEKITVATTKHRYHLMDLFRIAHWYDSRKELLRSLKSILSMDNDR